LDPAAPMNRRTALKRAGALAVALGALEAVGPFSFAPVRVGASIVPSDIQFDISAFLPVPPQNYGSDVQFQLPPVHTAFLTAALERTPTRDDQAEMNRALGVLEQHYPWGATHLVTFVAYGRPYFGRLPSGLAGSLVVPSAEFFRTLRTSQASLDLQEKYSVAVEDNGLERFLTATRRQNFLIPRAATAPFR
jgi:hypothetical protein